MKHAQQRVRESREKYRILFNAGRDAIFVHGFDREGTPDRFIEVNEPACQLLGYTKRQLLKKTPEDIRAPGTEVDFQKPGQETLFERILISKDGRRIPVEISIEHFKLKGEPTALAIARDISDRIAANDALIHSEQRFRELFNNMSSGVAVYQITEDGTDFIIKDFNKAGEKLDNVKHSYLTTSI